MAQAFKHGVVVLGNDPEGESPQELAIPLLAGFHQNRLDRQLPAQGHVAQRLGLGRRERQHVQVVVLKEVGAGHQAMAAQGLPHHGQDALIGLGEHVAHLERTLIALWLELEPRLQLGHRRLHRGPVPVAADLALPMPVGQVPLGRARVDLRAGLGDPQTGIGKMQLAIAVAGGLEASAGDHTDRQIGIGTEPATQLGKTGGIGGRQAGIEIEHKQALGGRHPRAGGGKAEGIPAIAEPEGRALASGLNTALPGRPQIVGHMGVPAVVTAHRLDAVVAPAAPLGWLGQSLLDGRLEGIQIGYVHQGPVVASGQDVPRPAVVGGHHRQPAGGCLQQGEPERFGEGRIDEQPPQPGGPAVDLRDLLAPVLLGIGDVAVEIKAVDKFEHLLEHVPLGLVELARILPATEHQHEVVVLAQVLGTAEHLHQGGDVLALIGAADGQHRRLGGVTQERRHQLGDRPFLRTGLGRVELAAVHAGGNHLGEVRPEAAVSAVLAVTLLGRTGHDQMGMGQGQLLGIDALGHGVLLLDLPDLQPCGHQPPALFPAQGMAREHQGDAQPAAQESSHVTGIGVVGMDPVGQPRLGQQPFAERISQLIEMGPEQLLAQVAGRTEGNALNRGAGGDRLTGQGVVQGDPAVADQTGDHLHPIHLRTHGHGPGQFEHIGGLAAGVRIAAQFEVTGSQQPVQVQVENVETSFGGHGSLLKRQQRRRLCSDLAANADLSSESSLGMSEPVPAPHGQSACCQEVFQQTCRDQTTASLFTNTHIQGTSTRGIRSFPHPDAGSSGLACGPGATCGPAAKAASVHTSSRARRGPPSPSAGALRLKWSPPSASTS